MITPEILREWANDADEGEDVALDGETLRETACSIELLRDELRELVECVEGEREELYKIYCHSGNQLLSHFPTD